MNIEIEEARGQAFFREITSKKQVKKEEVLDELAKLEIYGGGEYRVAVALIFDVMNNLDKEAIQAYSKKRWEVPVDERFPSGADAEAYRRIVAASYKPEHLKIIYTILKFINFIELKREKE